MLIIESRMRIYGHSLYSSFWYVHNCQRKSPALSLEQNLVVLFSDFHPGFLKTASLDSFASLAVPPSARSPWSANVLLLRC